MQNINDNNNENYQRKRKLSPTTKDSFEGKRIRIDDIGINLNIPSFLKQSQYSNNPSQNHSINTNNDNKSSNSDDFKSNNFETFNNSKIYRDYKYNFEEDNINDSDSEIGNYDVVSNLSDSDASSSASLSNILKSFGKENQRFKNEDSNFEIESSESSISIESDSEDEDFVKILTSMTKSNDFLINKEKMVKKEINNKIQTENLEDSSELESENEWNEHLNDLFDKVDYLLNNNKVKIEKNITLEDTKLFLNGKLFDFQIFGLNWMIDLYTQFQQKNENGGFILADEMGLGKTIQIIAFLSWLKEYSIKRVDPILVICPVSMLEGWYEEMSTWSKNLVVLRYHGKTEERYKLHREYMKKNLVDVIISSYEIVKQDFFLFKKYHYEYIIADEAHRLRNNYTKTVQLFKKFESNGRILVTGTPLNNNLLELFTLMNFILPKVFGDVDQLCSWFGYKTLNTKSNFEAKYLINKLHNLLRPFLLRRIKSEVNIKIPPKHEYIIYVDMEKEQRELYDELMKKAKMYYRTDRSNQALGILMNMKKLCNHPFLIQPFVFEEGQNYENIKESFITNSRASCGKFRTLMRMLKKFKEQNRKIIIFSLMTKMLDIIEYYLQFDPRYPYRRLDGSTPQKKRQQYINEFNENNDIFCFLISTKAGGIGITLTSADTIIIYDSDWNPQNDIQAISRASRIGQKKLLHAYRFITINSVENHIMNVAIKKLNLEKVVIKSGQFANTSKEHKVSDGDLLRDILTRKNKIQSKQPIDRKALKWLLNFNQNQSIMFQTQGENGYEKLNFSQEKQQSLGFELIE